MGFISVDARGKEWREEVKKAAGGTVRLEEVEMENGESKTESGP